jgi:hypothetical protein
VRRTSAQTVQRSLPGPWVATAPPLSPSPPPPAHWQDDDVVIPPLAEIASVKAASSRSPCPPSALSPLLARFMEWSVMGGVALAGGGLGWGA